ncbi:MAG: ABC transporter substrate-binding protein [Propionibacteriaceae bacterium]|jgi:glucose/mannose transport system substrate-binding protein|nr:ABC transporter substrate-binding protein [Propionibacteriaceae bacterium]
MRHGKIIAALSAAALALAGLAGCGSGEPTTPSTDAPVDGPSGQLEIFSWWTAGSEANGLEALVGVLGEKYPNIEFVNNGAATGGGSGKDVLQTRMAGGQPPDSFQVHAGAEAQDYITAGQLQDVSNLYDEFGLNNAFPQDLVDLLTKDGKIYTIPSNVHRSNVIWADVKALEKAGLSTTDAYYDSMESFIAALETAKAAGFEAPLSMGMTWTQVHLLETVLMADLTPVQYNGLFDGTTDWTGAEVKKALEDFGKLMSYTNADRDSLDWEEALAIALDQKAVFNVMGDWVPGALDARNLVDGTDYLWAPSPGTDGVYGFLADSFGLTTGGPNPDAGKAWLDVISSADGQTAFNKVKGSIPARTDIDLSSFSDYQQSASKSFKNDVIVGSIQHGAAATIAQGNAVNAAVSKFTTSPMAEANLATLQAELAAAFA